MKIGILTQPLKTNYGGLIQAFALKTTLEKLNHEVIIINRVGFLRRNQRIIIKILSNIKKYIFRTFGMDNKVPKELQNIIESNCAKFIQKYIKHVSADIESLDALYDYVNKMHFDGYVVGSDQIWRPNYSPCIENYYIDFCNDEKVKKIAYAASFGGNAWEYTAKETAVCSALAKKFNAISVREDSGVELCNKYLGVKAKHVLDPTMLLEKEEYEQIVNEENVPQSNGTLFYYFLDDNPTKQELIKYVEKECNKTSYNCMPAKKVENKKNILNVEDYIFPSPTKWLKSFMDAEMVVTDSFHGTVFSIIFNKPFWVIYNAHRGNTRFDSLLKLFGLTERIIDITDYSNIDFNKSIDWDNVNAIRQKNKQEALEFIKNNLNI